MDDKYNKVNLKISQLKQIRPCTKIACKIYKQTILPLMDYGDFMTESGPISSVKPLEKLQLNYQILLIIQEIEFDNVSQMVQLKCTLTRE